jgi:TRAP-type mannitol/chloroaromatic compound transport system permease small subunit
VVQLLAVQKFLLHSNVSRLPLWPGQSPVQYVPVAVFPGVKQSGHEGEHSPAYGVEIKNNCSNMLTPAFVFVASSGTSLTLRVGCV